MQEDLSWHPPDYRVDQDGKVIGGQSPTHPHNWGRFGSLDEKGTANLIQPESIVQAARLINDGEVFSLSIPLERGGPVHPERLDVLHVFQYAAGNFVTGSALNTRFPRFQGSDDYIVMPLQAGTQWDGLSHAASEDLLYNGFWAGTVEGYGGARRCGIHKLSGSLVGRGVLLDIARYHNVDYLSPGYPIDGKDLQECVEHEGVDIHVGDILLIRTGHIPRYYSMSDKAEFWRLGAPGLGRDSCEWLYEANVSAVAVDTVAAEVEPFEEPWDVIYPLHVKLIRDLGLSIGELWWLEELAEACEKDGRYEFFLSAPPLNITNGSGSPVNPVAIR